MAGRFSRSWDLVQASWAVLKQDKELLVFPLVSSIALLGVLACFALPAIGLGAFDGLSNGGGIEMDAALYGLTFLFYLVSYFVGLYFNAALVGAAMKRMAGGDPTVGDGFALANARIGSIFGYAVIAATVGMVLRMIQERVGFLGKIVVGLIGAGWSVATFLVVPMLVAREIGPVDAVKESAHLLRRTWGENVIGQAGMGLVFFLIYFAIVIVGVALIVAAAFAKSMVLAFTAIALLVLALVGVALVHGALAGIYSAALYRYATDESASGPFGADTLQLAFKPK